jgi:hypothetical protein
MNKLLIILIALTLTRCDAITHVVNDYDKTATSETTSDNALLLHRQAGYPYRLGQAQGINK